MKKNLQLATLALAMTFSLGAQNNLVVAKSGVKQTQSGPATPQQMLNILNRGCASGVPSQQWEEDFQKQVQAFVAEKMKAEANGKTNAAIYTIPVIFHIIHGGQAVGTYPNLAVGQVTSQVTVLNEDYAGIGLNVGNYPATAFQSYASSTVANLPAASKDGSGRVKIADCQIQFCLAAKDPTGAVLANPGIERINYTTKGWSNPASFTSSSAFQTYFDGTIKPQSIWPVTRYLNIWVSDCNSSIGLLGYATFPPSTTLTVMPGPFGTTTTDGVWLNAGATGSSSKFPGGTYAAPFDKGRSATHEVGHWLGLRHIGGDVSGGCGNDGCLDTPPNKACGGTCGNGFGQNYGAPTYPFHANQCAGPPANVNGDMFMNFMDYTDDAAMYMFTNDQSMRCQTAMTQCPYRNQLTASAATLCTLPSAAPVASIGIASTGCQGTGIPTSNMTTGVPSPTYLWSTNPAGGVFNPNNTAATPTITFPSAMMYTVTCVATNSLGSNSNSKTISITACAAVCKDTITNVQTTATLNLATAGSDTTTPGCSPKAGYIFGSNCYDDLEKAEYFTQSMYSTITTPKITDVIVLFFKNGTQGTGGNSTTPVNLKLYNGTMASGPSGTTTPIATATANLGSIVGTAPTTSVNYCGQVGIVYASPIIIPYKYTFPTNPAAPATNGFFASVTIPTAAGDTAVVMSDNTLTTGTNWELWSPNGWYNVSPTWGGFDASMAILPIISCSVSTGIAESELAANVNLMPNPTTGIFNIVTTLPNVKDIHLTVTNSIGQQITEVDLVSVKSGVYTVDLSAYNNGVYFITLQANGEKVVKRVVVSK